jgi:phage terminase large subunit-like protein
MVWYPDENWAHEVIEECAAFPNGQHDDYVDSTTQAMLRYRQGGLVTTYQDEADEFKIEREYKYYA